MPNPKFDREINEWWERAQKAQDRRAQAKGFATWQEFQDDKARKIKEAKEANKREEAELAAQGIVRTGTPTLSERLEMFGPNECNCQGQFDERCVTAVNTNMVTRRTLASVWLYLSWQPGRTTQFTPRFPWLRHDPRKVPAPKARSDRLSSRDRTSEKMA